MSRKREFQSYPVGSRSREQRDRIIGRGFCARGHAIAGIHVPRFALNRPTAEQNIPAGFVRIEIPGHPLGARRLLKKQMAVTLAHPAFQRGLRWATWDGARPPWRKGLSVHNNRARARVNRTADEEAMYPGGTIFIPHMQQFSQEMRGYSADDFLRKYLGELGLLAE